MMELYKADRIFYSGAWVTNKLLAVENSYIKGLVAPEDPGAASAVFDFSGSVIIPGLVDLQVNGCNGALLSRDLDADCLAKMQSGCLKHGTTSILPTLITCPDRDILSILKLLEDLMINKRYPAIHGLHLEGPFISKAQKGAHQESLIRNLDSKIFNILCEYGRRGVLKLLTIAPETVSAEQVRDLVSSGIIVSVGHSACTYEELKVFIDNGLKSVTHLYNAMPPLRGREPGIIGAAFANEHMFAGIIPDLIHSDAVAVKAAFNAMGARLYAVSDASASKDLAAETSFEFGGKQCYVNAGKIVNTEGRLAGSALSLDDGLNNLIQILGLDNALKMCTEIPASLALLNTGKLEQAYRADFNIVNIDANNKLSFISTYLAGSLI